MSAMLHQQNESSSSNEITAASIVRTIDVSAVRTHHSKQEIDVIIDAARKHRFINVHVLPNWMRYLADALAEVDNVFPGGPVGFPSGGHKLSVKCFEAEQLILDGADEVDLVINVGRLKNQEYNHVLQEIRELRTICENRILKVIIEINCLTDEEVLIACDLCIEGQADYVKSGSGWIDGGVNLVRIKMILDHVGNAIKVKAAGGIRTLDQYVALHAIGVARFGINNVAAIQILDQIRRIEARS